MSVWPTSFSADPFRLHGLEGELVSVQVTIEPKLLEELLEALAEVPFPINPEIHHHATMWLNGHVSPAVLVEFPAYANHLEEAQRVLQAHGFDRDSIRVVNMLDEIHAR